MGNYVCLVAEAKKIAHAVKCFILRIQNISADHIIKEMLDDAHLNRSSKLELTGRSLEMHKGSAATKQQFDSNLDSFQKKMLK